MVKSFFVRWWVGVKEYLSSPTDLLFLKLLFLGFVVFGLFAGSVQMFFVGQFWLGWILGFFGLVSCVDFRLLYLHYQKLKGYEGLLK